jgi:hypothetical protein
MKQSVSIGLMPILITNAKELPRSYFERLKKEREKD